MNIKEIKTPITAAILNESLAKRYGTKIDISKFTLPQLEDARNKIRTMLKDIETNESFDAVKSESYQKSKLFLDVLNQAIKEVPPIVEGEDDKMPSKAHIMKMCKDGKTKAEICKMHPNCDQGKLKDMIDDCMKEMKESTNEAKFKKTGKEGDGSFDESGCVGEMKRLDASGCTKEEMKKKITAEYDVDDAKFEKLYASNCG